MKISQKISVVTGITVLLVLGLLGWISISQARHILTIETNRFLEISISDAEVGITDRVKRVKLLASILASDEQLIQRLSLAKDHDLSSVLNEPHRRDPYVEYVALFNREGKVIASSTMAREGNVISSTALVGQAMWEPFIPTVVERGVTWFYGSSKDPWKAKFGYDAKPFNTLVLSPVMEGSEVLGVVMMSYNWMTSMRQRMEIFRRHFVAEGFETISAELLTSDGLSIISVGFLEDIQRGSKVEGRISRSIPLIIDELKLHLRISMDERELLKPIRRLQVLLYMCFAFAIPLLILALYGLLQKVILKKLKLLGLAVEKMGRGDLEYRIQENYNDELGDLAQSFNQMIGDFQKTTVSRDSLLKEVVERKRAEEKQRELATVAASAAKDQRMKAEELEKVQDASLNIMEDLDRQRKELEKAYASIEGTKNKLMREIEERHKLEKELHVSRESFRSVVNKQSDGIIVVDQEEIVRFVNPAAANLFGYKSEDILNQKWSYPIVPTDYLEVDIVRANGEPGVAEMSAVETTWEGKKACLTSLRDITNRKEAEESLRKSEKQLHRSQRMEAIGKLAGGVAHDFNNQLFVMAGHCNMMLKMLKKNVDSEMLKKSIR